MKRGHVRRARLRLLRIAGTPGAAWDPPLLSLSPRHLRRVEREGRSSAPIRATREELWVRGASERLRATIDEAGKLSVLIEGGEAPVTLDRLVRIPTGREPSEGRGRYFGRWEYGKTRVVLSASGAGVLVPPDSKTLEHEPELADVYEGEGLLLALRNVPNGARVLCAEGVNRLEVDALVSDIVVPEIERGPDVTIDPHEAFLRGFAPVGFRATFAGLDFDGFAPSQGEGSGALARFLQKPRGVDYGAVRSVEPSEDEDALLRLRLAAELSPSPVTGRVRLGKAGTITLTDGRRYRVQAGVRERLPKGSIELVTCALLDGVLLATVCVSHERLQKPDANVVLAKLNAFLLGLHALRPDGAPDA